MQKIIDRTEKPEYKVHTFGIEGFGTPKRDSFEKTERQSPPQDSDASYLNERWLYMYGMPDEFLYRHEGITENYTKDELVSSRLSGRLDLTDSEEQELKSNTGRDMLDTVDNLSSLENQVDFFKEINYLRAQQFQIGREPTLRWKAGLIGHNTFMYFDDAAVKIKPTEPTREEDYMDEYGTVKTTQMKANDIQESYSDGITEGLKILQRENPSNDLQALRIIDKIPTIGEDWAFKEGVRAVTVTILRTTGQARDPKPIYDAVDQEVNRLTNDGQRMAILR